MIRNTVLALTAVAVIGAAAISPAAATYGHYGVVKVVKVIKVVEPYCYFKKKWTWYGWKLIKICPEIY
jgi:hypothetical protein